MYSRNILSTIKSGRIEGRGKQTKVYCFLHCNALVYTVETEKAAMCACKFEILNQPPHRPVLICLPRSRRPEAIIVQRYFRFGGGGPLTRPVSR
ncbi:hypothetical protein EVAR_19387_1 [Eumeta japonica]|uniref:Uncharacterized protein n=1 Tax=Eumeta variegata TaxID=151549 RepID=A0A4C1TRG9_EUMVA|nr:hypothetical protein EVAR_19387_1 [Eumeta japonica]